MKLPSLTDAQKQAYLMASPESRGCPYCGSHAVDAADLELIRGGAQAEMWCCGCYARWVERYALVAVEELDRFCYACEQIIDAADEVKLLGIAGELVHVTCPVESPEEKTNP